MKPKTNARAIRHGFPWVFAGEVVTDRRTKGLAPGTLAVLEDELRQPMGVVAVNPNSKIFCRMLDQNPAAVIDQAWLEARLARALEMRERLYDAPFYRLVHAEADGLPGVVIDRFGDTCVVQPNAAWAEGMIDLLSAALVTVTGVRTVLKSGTGRARTLELAGRKPGCSLTSAPIMPLPRACRKMPGFWTYSAMSEGSDWPRWRRARKAFWRSMDQSRRWHWPLTVRKPRAWPTVLKPARATLSMFWLPWPKRAKALTW
jgi:hypothetical protein